jgi:HEAT repeats
MKWCRYIGRWALFAFATAAHALPAQPDEGWVSWEIEAPAHARDICCHAISLGGTGVVRQSCDLDGARHGFTITGGDASATAVRVYAHYRAGHVDAVRTYSADCPVRASTPIVALGRRDAESSLRAITPRSEPGKRDREHLLAAISMHPVPRAFSLLASWALRGGDPALRKESMFWLAQAAYPETEATLQQVLAQERDGDVREQAIFALSQLPAARASAALIDLVDDARGHRADRKRALFWLAQSDDDAAFVYLDERLQATGH